METVMTGPKNFHHTTIDQQYHALYSAEVFTRIDACYAEQERQMRECMGNRDNYDLDGVRAVVANWEKHCPNGNAHRVALAVLAERLAELEPQAIDIAFADEADCAEIQRIEKHNSYATTMRQLLDLRDQFDEAGNVDLRDQTIGLINSYAAKILGDQDVEIFLEDQDAAEWDRGQAAVRRAENGGQPVDDNYADLPDEDGRRRYDHADECHREFSRSPWYIRNSLGAGE